jgi:hypothetical protein
VGVKPPDKLAVEQLLDAFNATDYCTYLFCPGERRIATPMATCHTCYTRMMLRRALTRMGIGPLKPLYTAESER